MITPQVLHALHLRFMYAREYSGRGLCDSVHILDVEFAMCLFVLQKCQW